MPQSMDIITIQVYKTLISSNRVQENAFAMNTGVEKGARLGTDHVVLLVHQEPTPSQIALRMEKLVLSA